mmetsp:Transcript_13583/g.25065  ORF Transcript_13583/g.25065 Transcript_13583/m.25065 type:complete len:114 (+) Transcript_13583:2-343(+)
MRERFEEVSGTYENNDDTEGTQAHVSMFDSGLSPEQLLSKEEGGEKTSLPASIFDSGLSPDKLLSKDDESESGLAPVSMFDSGLSPEQLLSNPPDAPRVLGIEACIEEEGSIL